VETTFGIGDFSKMTYLSVKALRHYHDVGLLEPARIDPATGYRRYAAHQVPVAHAIRRFRDLDMPLDQLRRVLAAPDERSRNRAILEHLESMQRQLDRTRATVASLQALLSGPQAESPQVTVRHLPAISVVSVSEPAGFDAAGDWVGRALEQLHAEVDRLGIEVAGADGALYPDELFELGEAVLTAFVPVVGDLAGDERVATLPGITAAVLLHEGSFDDLDQAYAALGTAVAERGIGGPGPVREHYLTPTSTEVCWPVSTGAPR
jgi:DNA-binding transcriptional MerR regulator